jgi:predicted secreted protein
MKTRQVIGRRRFLRSSVGSSLALAGCKGASGEEPVSSGVVAAGSALVDEPQVRRDFSKDGRSKRVVFAAHCILNQNARHVDCADFSAVMKPLVAVLEEEALGIIQMPCPELMVLGLGRDRDVPPLDTIREALELPDAHERLKPLIADIMYQIKEYQFQGFDVVGILGKNGSPACGVETTSLPGGEAPGEGVFVRLLRERLQVEGLDIRIKGVDDYRQEETISWVLARVSRGES